MLSDFTKLNTFLTVVRERSFSKASAKLGISQPAVTQQIKFIEDYLDLKVIDRKKNGIKLTKEGDQLLNIVLKLEKAIANAEKEVNMQGRWDGKDQDETRNEVERIAKELDKGLER